MKKIFLIASALVCLDVNAQTYDLTPYQSNVTEKIPNQTIIIQPSIGDNSGPVGIVTCHSTPGTWTNDCYVINVTCTSNTGLTVVIDIVNCYREIASSKVLSNDPKNQLLDLSFKFVGSTIPSDIDNLKLQEYKNQSITISEDSYYKGKEGNVIIKAGTYKIKNSKLHTLMSIQ